MLNLATLRTAAVGSLVKLDPRAMIHNPVMFVVEVGALFTTVGFIVQLSGGEPLGGGDEGTWFTGVVSLWLWLTVIFGNLAEAMAEGRGKAQAAALRAMRTRPSPTYGMDLRWPRPSSRAETWSWSRRAR